MTCQNCAAWKAEVDRVQNANPELPVSEADPMPINEIIDHLKSHQWTHTDWASWFEAHPDDPRITAVGTAEFHRKVEARYSRMIAGLLAISPQ